MLQLLSVPLQNGLRFLQHPLPVIPSAFLADAPAFTRRRDVGFAMFGCPDTNGLAPASTPAACFVRVLLLHGWSTLAALPFGLSLSASLALCILRCLWQFTFVGHFIQPCLSDRIDACSRGNHLAAVSSSCRWRDVVSAASDPTVASRAGADRLLRTEPQVRLMSCLISNDHSNHFTSHMYVLHKMQRSPGQWKRKGHEEVRQSPRAGLPTARFAICVIVSIVVTNGPSPIFQDPQTFLAKNASRPSCRLRRVGKP